ncbi:MAG TPA: leucine-rich repeat domain-containing protein [Pyrinomonadaceae bacterium]|nr:leucine-rich repeat domain-containing protein [Pyrinomonadaceae bacterium]
MRSEFKVRSAVGFVALCLFVGAWGVARGSFRQEQAVESLAEAFKAPERVKRLVLQSEDHELKHLPARLGTLVNLEALEIACLENLEDLPEEIGALRKLEELVIDNGNGCSMNVSLPRSIGQLENLRVLRLYGALDGRDLDAEEGARKDVSKPLPETLSNLSRLEELDLGRNGLTAVPTQVGALRGLKKLGLDYNDIRVLPSFVGNLTGLRELSLNSNGGVTLPDSLAGLKGLKVFMGNNKLTLAGQRSLRRRFPAAVFNFENEYDDDAANEEPKQKPRRARRR